MTICMTIGMFPVNVTNCIVGNIRNIMFVSKFFDENMIVYSFEITSFDVLTVKLYKFVRC